MQDLGAIHYLLFQIAFDSRVVTTEIQLQMLKL